MKTVSLLPPELKGRRITQRKHSSILVYIFLLLVLVVLVNIGLLVQSYLLKNDLKSLQDQRAGTESQVAALQEYAALHDQLVARENLIQDLMGTPPLWSSLIQNISYHLPNGVWITEISARYEETGGEIDLRGWAYDHSDVAEMLEQIYTLDKLDDIRCQVSTATFLEGQPVVQFLVKARLNSGPPFLALTEGEG